MLSQSTVHHLLQLKKQPISSTCKKHSEKETNTTWELKIKHLQNLLLTSSKLVC